MSLKFPTPSTLQMKSRWGRAVSFLVIHKSDFRYSVEWEKWQNRKRKKGRNRKDDRGGELWKNEGERHCLSRIPDPIFSFPDPGSCIQSWQDLGSRTQKNYTCTYAKFSNIRSRIIIPDRYRIRILSQDFFSSRIRNPEDGWVLGTLGKRARESSKPQRKRRAEGGYRGGEGEMRVHW